MEISNKARAEIEFNKSLSKIKERGEFLDSLVSGTDKIYLEIEGISREVIFLGAPIVPNEPYLPSFPIICADLNSEVFYVAERYDVIPKKRKILFTGSFTKKNFDDTSVHDSWKKLIGGN